MFEKQVENAAPSKAVRGWGGELAQKGWWHSFELPDGRVIEGVSTLAALKLRLAQFPIPEDLSGKRVLDIGAWDGWFSFEMERRGAEVTSIDCWDNERFRYIHRALGSKIDYRVLDFYELLPAKIGTFDIVLFQGVLYHLKHPLLALERVCALTKELAAVESFVITGSKGNPVPKHPVMEFYETDEFGGQFDNWVGPNVECLMAMCRAAGFARVELQSLLPNGACVACFRHWEPKVSRTLHAAPKLIEVQHHTNFGVNFYSNLDEYGTCWFATEEKALSRASLRPEVGGYGAQPVMLMKREDDRWQVNFKLPPGLAPGWHEVRIATVGSKFSEPLRIAVDLPAKAESLAITSVCDAKSWTPGKVHLDQDPRISAWVAGLPENADRNNVRMSLSDVPLSVIYVEAPKGAEPRQLNAKIPAVISAGEYKLTVSIGEVHAAPIAVTLESKLNG